MKLTLIYLLLTIINVFVLLAGPNVGSIVGLMVFGFLTVREFMDWVKQ